MGLAYISYWFYVRELTDPWDVKYTHCSMVVTFIRALKSTDLDSADLDVVDSLHDT